MSPARNTERTQQEQSQVVSGMSPMAYVALVKFALVRVA